MVQRVMLSIQGQQDYEEQEPEIMRLITEGTLEQLPGGWRISYAESDLTGLEGVTTTFLVSADSITLTRKGKLQSEMFFRVGERNDSLYRMEFGALMISVCANRLLWDIDENGGVIDLEYQIEIEQSAVGVVTYHLDIAPISE